MLINKFCCIELHVYMSWSTETVEHSAQKQAGIIETVWTLLRVVEGGVLYSWLLLLKEMSVYISSHAIDQV